MIYTRFMILASILQGCALQLYVWMPDDTAPMCESVVWKQIDSSRIPGLCYGQGKAASAETSCALGCVVISPYSEKEAKNLMMRDGMTLYLHEAEMHVFRRLRHD